MANLSFIEKQTLVRLFGIEGGFVFKYWIDAKRYNKNKTQAIILESCNIDIYKDPDYNELSQQKCIEKIWEEKDTITIANLIQALCNYFDFQMGSSSWTPEDKWDYQEAQKIIKRLHGSIEVSLPQVEDTPDIRLLAEDIEKNVKQNKPELALDRLHTYATTFIRKICTNHVIDIADEGGNYYSLEGLVGQLRKYYERQNCFESKFSCTALKLSTSLFADFNSIRNDNSFTHPNPVLEKNEAEYVVKIMLATLKFINVLEEILDDDLPF